MKMVIFHSYVNVYQRVIGQDHTQGKASNSWWYPRWYGPFMVPENIDVYTVDVEDNESKSCSKQVSPWSFHIYVNVTLGYPMVIVQPLVDDIPIHIPIHSPTVCP